MTQPDDIIPGDAAAFLSPHAFGEPLLVNGIEVDGRWGEESLSAFRADAWSATMECAVLYLPEGVLEQPVPGQQVNVDGVRWTVRRARPHMGLMRLELERQTS